MDDPLLLDAESVHEFLARVVPRARPILGRYQILHPDTEDLIQDALLATFCGCKEIQNREGWFLVTIRNLCHTHQRRRRYWDRLVNPMDTEILQQLYCPYGPAQEQREAACDLNALFCELQDNDRQLMHLYFIEELGPTEIASRMGCHPANVRKVVCRSLARLKTAAATPPLLRRI